MLNSEVNYTYPYIIEDKSKEPKLILSNNRILKTNNGYYFHIVDSNGNEVSRADVNIYELEKFLRLNNLYGSELHSMLIYMNAVIAGSAEKEFHNLLRVDPSMVDSFVRITINNRTGRDFYITYGYLKSRLFFIPRENKNDANIITLSKSLELSIYNNLSLSIRFKVEDGTYVLGVVSPLLCKDDESKLKSHYGVEYGYSYTKAYRNVLLNKDIRYQLLLFLISCSGLYLHNNIFKHYAKRIDIDSMTEVDKDMTLHDIYKYFEFVYDLFNKTK